MKTRCREQPAPAALPAVARARVALCRGLVGGMLVALHGCAAVAPPSGAAPIEDMPPGWSGGGSATPNDASSLAGWWVRFGDPLLTDLVGQALRANTSVSGAEAALRQARALREVAAAALLPRLDASASARRSRSSNGTTGNFEAGIAAGWEVDLFGAGRSALDVADANARTSAAALGDVQVAVAAEVALAYFALRGTQARYAIAEANLASQQETSQLTQWRVQAGLASSLDAEQARAATAQTRAQLPALRTSIEQGLHALAVLVGRPPAALAADRLATTAPVPLAPAALTLGIPADTLRQRADVRAAEHRVDAAAARVAQVDAERRPRLNLDASLGLGALTLASLGSGASVAAALAAGVSAPLFDGGAGVARLGAEQAALDQAQAAYRAAVLAALKQVEDALFALRGDAERLLHLREAAESAANAALLARQRYASGLIDFQTVLDTQRSQLSTQDAVAAAEAELGADHVRLYRSLGGGWLAEPPAASAGRAATRTSPP